MVILGPLITEKSSNQIALNKYFGFPDILGKICPFLFDNFSLISGPKTTHFIYLERRSYILLKYIKIAIVGPEITTLFERS